MNGTATEDFNPAGTFTETAAFSAAFKAGNINLCTRLCKREMMWSEFCLCLRSEQFLCKLLQSSFKICKCNILVDDKTFNLMEGRRMCRIYFVRTEYTSRCDHTDRQFALFHGTCLYRGSLRTKKNRIIDKECILLISCRMIFRNIQFCKVIICIFYFRTLYYFIAHSDKNTLYFFECNAVWMTMTDHCFLCRKCNVDHFCFHFFFTKCFFQFLSGCFQMFFNLHTGLIYHLTYFWTIFRINIFHTL